MAASSGTKHRRPERPRARQNMLSADGSLIRAGERIAREQIPTKDIDRLGSHGLVDRRKGDDGLDSG